MRGRWPEVEVANLREFTTGYGPRSGGRRRPHWNLLLKGVPAEAAEEAGAVAARVWCGLVDADPERQHAGRVYEAGGLGRYLALHFQKESQAPPKGWKGHRFTSSRGYFPDGVRVAREKAREAVAVERAVYRANALAEAVWQDQGVVLLGEELEDLVQERLELNRSARWEVVQVRRQSEDVDRKRAEGAREPLRRAARKRSGGSS